MRPALAALALALAAAGCASVVRDGPPARPFPDQEAIRLYVRWREAERQRDEGKLAAILHFASEADRAAFGRALEDLRGKPPGQVVAETEVHLVDRPPDGGAGDHLFLVPVGARLYPERVRIVFAQGEPRIEYEPPVLSLAEAALRWRSLQGEALAAEVARTRRHLAAQARAVRYASEKGLEIAPISPDPGEVLASLDLLGDEAVRERILGQLGGGRNTFREIDPGSGAR